MSIVVYLSLSTYAGITPAAIHWYGRLRWGPGPAKEIELERRLTAAQATRWNDDEAALHEDGPALWAASDDTNRFDSEMAVITAASLEFTLRFGPDDVLIRGSAACCDPQQVLLGPNTLMTAANRLWSQWVVNDGWEGDEDMARDIAADWDRLWRKRL